MIKTVILFMITMSAMLTAQDFHQPITAQEGEDPFRKRDVKFVEPSPLNLPSKEKLTTYRVAGRTYHIKQIAPESWTWSQTEEGKKKVLTDGVAVYENPNQALYFHGTGGGGRRSRERLIVENCTFVIDYQKGNFKKWDDKRCAIRVQGFREVLIRNCIFIVANDPDDPVRKTCGSIVAYDCLKVQVENCFFEGLTTWFRGHVLVFCCGPTWIRNIEVRGARRNDQYISGGGIWVATGVGEGKIGWVHQRDPEMMIYPAGPALIENCWIHDQNGKSNTDGIYVQSIHPFLIRNCKVENWMMDSLLDVGFRDTAGHKYKGKVLVNHGSIGVIENCEFSGGFLKNSVGAAGGIVWRNNLMKDIWFMPYTFDGGHNYFVGNEFVDLTGAAIAGDDHRDGGWGPSMFKHGSKLYAYNNLFQARPGATLRCFLKSKVGAPLVGNVFMDYNIYDMSDAKVLVWAKDEAAKKTYASFEEWKAAAGCDQNSVYGKGDLKRYASVPSDALKLPGGLKMDFGKPKHVGLTGSVGVTPELRRKALELSLLQQRRYENAHLFFEFEKLTVTEKSTGVNVKEDKRSWYSGGRVIRLDVPPGGRVSYRFSLPVGGVYNVSIAYVLQNKGVCQLLIDGKKIGKPKEIKSTRNKGIVNFGQANLAQGEHVLTLKAGDKSLNCRLDRMNLDAIRRSR